MAKVKKKLNIGLLKDSPVLKNDKKHYDFYHKYISPALNEIIENKSSISTIGLLSPWGSGKSTIIENLAEDYKSKYPVFIFDAWKYKEDPLRRTFLIKLLEFGNSVDNFWKKNRKPEKDFLDELYESTELQKAEELEEDNQTSKFNKWWSRVRRNSIVYIFAGSAILTIVVWVVLQYKVGEGSPLVSALLPLSGILSLSTVAWAVVVATSKEVISKVTSWLLEDLRTDIRTQTITKRRDFLNSPEQFEHKFKDLINRCSKRVVIVFDNIDRVQGDVAIDILSSVKTFFDVHPQNRVVFIIPCDAIAIEEQIKNYYQGLERSFDPSEYLRKIFNITITAPEFIFNDIEEYTLQRIDDLDNGTNLFKDDKLKLQRVVTYAFKSPRAIKQFLNNFAGMLLIAYHSEDDVWLEISKNIPYLAKIQVIRQRFPKEYEKLISEKLFDPENITLENSSNDFVNFMRSTNNITVANAKPYIYFKVSNNERNVIDAKLLIPALIQENAEISRDILIKNRTKLNSLFEFVKSLCKEYRYEPIKLGNIIRTFLDAAELAKIAIEANLLSHMGEVVERDAWQEYKKFKTDVVFNQFINNAIINPNIRKDLVERYISAFDSEEIKNDSSKSIEIFKNILKSPATDDNHIKELRTIIEDSYFNNSEILASVSDFDLQEKYISSQTMSKYISALNFENLTQQSSVFIMYKEYIKRNSISNIVVANFTELIKNERKNSESFVQNKNIIFKTLSRVCVYPHNILDSSDEIIINNLASEVLLVVRATNLDEKVSAIPLLLQLHQVLGDPLLSDTKNEIATFLSGCSYDNLMDLSVELGLLNLLETFSNQFVEHIVKRAVLKGDHEVFVYYESFSTENQAVFVNSLIDQSSNLGLPFLSRVKFLPNKVQNISNFLSRVAQLASDSSRNEYYRWVISQISKSEEDLSLRNLIIHHILSLLKSNYRESHEPGYLLLDSSVFLSKDDRRDIGIQLINWLKDSSQTSLSSNKYIVWAINSVYSLLLKPQKEAYVRILFNLSVKAADNESIEIATETFKRIKPKWSTHKDDFNELKEGLSQNTNFQLKSLFVNSLLSLKPKNLVGSEKDYWTEFEKMKSQLESS